MLLTSVKSLENIVLLYKSLLKKKRKFERNREQWQLCCNTQHHIKLSDTLLTTQASSVPKQPHLENNMLLGHHVLNGNTRKAASYISPSSWDFPNR